MEPDSDRFFSPRVVAVAIVGYVIVAGLLITVFIKTAATDSAEQLVWAQDWRLGYGIQPPLYTWLQLVFFKIFGANLGALAFLKEILLGLTGWLTYLSVLRMTSDQKIAVLASASLLLMPQLSYESHRNLSHTLLTTALAAATLYLMVKLALGPKTRPSLYVWLGIVTGAGLLSKYNFAIFTTACCAAALCVPQLRRIVLNRWMLVTLVLGLLIFSPHAWWLANHFHDGLSEQMAVKLHPEASIGWLTSVKIGSATLIQRTIGMFFLPPLLVYIAGLLFWRKEKGPAMPSADLWRRFLGWLLVWEAVVVVMLLGFRVTSFQSRWFLPWLFVLPPYLVLRWHERIGTSMRRFVLAVSLGGGVMAVLVFALGAPIAKFTRHYHGADIPFEELAAKVQADGFNHGEMVSDEHWIIGNLRLHLSDTSLTTHIFQGPQRAGGEPVLIVWGPNLVMTPEMQHLVDQRWPGLLQTNAVKVVQLNYRQADIPAGKFSYVIVKPAGN